MLQGAMRNLLPYVSAAENVRFAQSGVPKARRAGLAGPRELLDMVGLAGHARTIPPDLAPGARQRLAIATALANGAGLLLADEPTSQLDTAARDEVLDVLSAVNRAGRTVVVVTHDPDVGGSMGRTVTIRDGRVGAEGRRGEEYSVVGRDGSVHLPPDVLDEIVPGTLLRVELLDGTTVRLTPAQDASREEPR
jgi:ABC-type lipoprotein export system ATPase subunit